MPTQKPAPFLVNAQLQAVPVHELIKHRKWLKPDIKKATDNPQREDRPVVKGSKLEVNTPYPSSAVKGRFYYLPEYVISRSNGKPDVELRYEPDTDGGDDIRRLTINVTWAAPRAARVRATQMRVMPHDAQLVLKYSVPVQQQGANAAADGRAIERRIALQPLVSTGATTARSVTQFADKQSFDAVYQAMRKASSNATLAVEYSAQVWVKSWHQLAIGRVNLADKLRLNVGQQALIARLKDQRRTVLLRGAALERVATPARPTPSRTGRAATPATARRAQPGRRAAAAALQPRLAHMPAAVLAPTLRAGTVGPQLGTLQGARLAPQLRARDMRRVAAAARAGGFAGATVGQLNNNARVSAEALKKIQKKTRFKLDGRTLGPSRIALDDAKRPALLSSTLRSSAALPFHFDAATSDVFVGTGGSAVHLMIQLDIAGQPVFQDNLMPDLVYVPPSVFRLVRDPLAPHAPSMTFLPTNIEQTGAEAGAQDVRFNMMMAYRLEPWIEPQLMDKVRETLAPDGRPIRFITNVSEDATLSLTLPSGLGISGQRTEATVDPEEGIDDTLMLDEGSFLKLWRDHLVPQGRAIHGTVAHTLFDGTTLSSDVRLSLWEPSEEFFETTFLGPVDGQPGVYRVRVRNRIESAVRVTAVEHVALTDSVIAHAQKPESWNSVRLKPQQAIDIEYRVSPAEAPVATLAPAVHGTVEPDIQALLQQLMVTPGTDALGFDLEIQALEGTFGAASDGLEPLTGLAVEFDDGLAVELDADEPSTQVTVTARLINAILGIEDTEQRYLYRVTNLHATGEGARTGWLEGHGSQSLEVGRVTASAGLD